MSRTQGAARMQQSTPCGRRSRLSSVQTEVVDKVSTSKAHATHPGAPARVGVSVPAATRAPGRAGPAAHRRPHRKGRALWRAAAPRSATPGARGCGSQARAHCASLRRHAWTASSKLDLVRSGSPSREASAWRQRRSSKSPPHAARRARPTPPDAVTRTTCRTVGVGVVCAVGVGVECACGWPSACCCVAPAP